MRDKNKRILVIQVKIPKKLNCVDATNFFDSIVNHFRSQFDDSVLPLFFPVDEIIGNKQVYDISGCDENQLEGLKTSINSYLKTYKEIHSK